MEKYDDAFSLAPLPTSSADGGDDGEASRGDWDAVQEAFFRFYVAVLKDYRRFLVFPGGDTPMGAGFKVKSFVTSQPKDFHPFLTTLCTTQVRRE